MCSPIALIGFAVSAASQVLTFKAQNDMADAENRRYLEAAKSAGKSLADQQSQEGVRMQQVQAQGVEKQLDLRREALRNKGTALASSTGGGLSEELLLADIERQQMDYSDIVAMNVKNEAQQSYWNKVGMVSDAQSRANANKPSGSSGGSVAGLGVGLLGSGLNAYNMYSSSKTPNTKDTKTAYK